LLADLHGAEDGQIDLAAADHREALVAAEDARALDGRDGLLAGVDQVSVDLVLGREWADAQHAVLALQPDFLVGRHEIGYQRGDADAQVHIEAVFEFLRRAGRHLVLCPGHVNSPDGPPWGAVNAMNVGPSFQAPFFSVKVRFSMRFSGWALTTMRCT